MHTLSVKRLGFALGAMGAIVYVVCVAFMRTVPHEAVTWIINSLLHGWDVAPLMRWDVPWWEAVVGTLETFVLGCLAGALFAVLYNLGARRKE